MGGTATGAARMKGEISVIVAIGQRRIRCPDQFDIFPRHMRPQNAKLSANRAIAIDQLLGRRSHSKTNGSAMAIALKHGTAE